MVLKAFYLKRLKIPTSDFFHRAADSMTTSINYQIVGTLLAKNNHISCGCDYVFAVKDNWVLLFILLNKNSDLILM